MLLISIVVREGGELVSPSTQHHHTPSFEVWVITPDELRHISGVLLAWPQASTQDTRIDLMSHNTEYLYGWIYDITNPRMLDRLTDQSAHYPVRIILENDKYMQFGDDFGKTISLLTGWDIIIYPDEDLEVIYTHAKTFVGDMWRVIQTANFNTSSRTTNREHFFLSQDETIRQDLLALFTLDQTKIADPVSITDADYQALLSTLSPELIVCPLNCRDKLETLLSQAQERIRISSQYILDSSILAILKSQVQAGKDLRILTNKLESNRALLKALWPDLISFDAQVYNHDKLIVIDDLVVVGSMNLSDNALDNNREIGVILKDPALLQQVESLFVL